MTGTLAIDIGQSGFRLRVGEGEVVTAPMGVDALTSGGSVRRLVDRIVAHVPAGAGASHVGIGLSGFVEGSPAPLSFAADVRERLRARSVAVAADAVTAFLGTVGPRPGTVAICGTGVASLGLGTEGAARRVDARGYLLGDHGGGFWIGQRGLQAALDAIEGRGAPTVLSRSVARLGSPADIYHAAMASQPAPKYVAAFAPDVLAAAGTGDAVAQRILAAAADEIARTIRAARTGEGPIGLTGGLTRSEGYVDAVRLALSARGVDAADLVVRPDAALEGARVLGEHPTIRPTFAGLIAVKEQE